DDEVVEFARLTLEQPFNVRFIELMPINWSQGEESPAGGGIASFYALAGSPGGGRSGGIRLYAHEELASFRRGFHVSTPAQPHGRRPVAPVPDGGRGGRPALAPPFRRQRRGH